MAIRASSARHIDALIGDLGAASAVARETAVARLTLLGARAVERLIAAAESHASADARAAAWRALEAIGDSRALEPALAALSSRDLDPAIGAAAAGLARIHVRGAHGATAVDRLTSVVLDRTRHETVRLAALRALRELEPSTIAPIVASLANDPNATIQAEAAWSASSAANDSGDPAALLDQAAGGHLPDDPATLRQALRLARESVLPPVLLEVIDRVREREGAVAAGARDEWRLARAAAHLALAERGSRLALYDLRESLETARAPLPVEFLAALTLAGDATCLEAIASAHARAKDTWWRDRLADAFAKIVAREQLTRRHGVMKRIEKRWPGLTPGFRPGLRAKG